MTAINPIPVVRNNLPAYRESLIREKAKLQDRIAKIDVEMQQLAEVARVLDICAPETTPLRVPTEDELVAEGL